MAKPHCIIVFVFKTAKLASRTGGKAGVVKKPTESTKIRLCTTTPVNVILHDGTNFMLEFLLLK